MQVSAWIAENGTEVVVECSGADQGGHAGSIRFLEPDWGPVPFGFDGPTGRATVGHLHGKAIVIVDSEEYQVDVDQEPQYREPAEDVATHPVDKDRGGYEPATADDAGMSDIVEGTGSQPQPSDREPGDPGETPSPSGPPDRTRSSGVTHAERDGGDE